MGEHVRPALESPLFGPESVLHSLPDPLLVVDRSGRVTFANRPAERLFEVPACELVGRRPDDPVLWDERGWTLLSTNPGETTATFAPLKRALVHGEAVSDIPLTVSKADRTRICVSVSMVPVFDPSGCCLGAAVQLRDTTDECDRLQQADTLRRDLLDSRKHIEELVRLERVLVEINTIVHSTLEFDEVLARMLMASAQALKVESGMILIRSGTHWEPRALHGLPPELLTRTLTEADVPHAALAAELGSATPIKDLTADERLATDMLRGLGRRGLLAVPLLVGGELAGALSLHRNVPWRFSYDEVSFVTQVATTASLAMENARTYEKERYIAETLQRALLERPAPTGGISVATLYESATEAAWIGGDFFDVFELPLDMVGVVIGDVSGKGVEASALAAFTRQLLRAHASEGLSPANVLRKTNDLVYRTTGPQDYVTLFFGVIPRGRRQLRYSVGGHPPAILWHDGEAACMTGGGSVVGALPDGEWYDHTIEFDTGDVLFLYTDGITEARNNGEFFGEARLSALVEALSPAPLDELAEGVVHAVQTFAKGRLRDDLAVMVVSPD